MDTPGKYTLRHEDGREFGPVDFDTILGWAREGRVSRRSVVIPVQKERPAFAAMDDPRLAAILSAPPTVGGPAPAAPMDDEGVATVIPYRNKPALVGYYLAIFGVLFAIFVPLLGLAMPIAAVVLGIKGRRAVRANPKLHGSVHAWIAILGGSFGILLGLANLAIVLMVMLAPR